MSSASSNSQKLFFRWFPLAVAISFVFLSVYVIAQQIIRMGADEQQLQMAIDASAGLSVGEKVSNYVPARSIDVDVSLSPFMIVYGDNGDVTGSSVVGLEKLPALPSGVLNYTRAHGEDRFTWQPKTGTRIAAVTEHYHGSNGSGVVLVGKNLRETEKRESQLGSLSTTGWLTTLVATYGGLIVAQMFTTKSSKKK